jgi:hypothetical protein
MANSTLPQLSERRRKHTSYSTEVSISNTDEAIILRAQDIMVRLGVVPYINSSKYKLANKPTHKMTWKLVVHRLNKNIRLLTTIGKYLTGMKKERGELVLEFCKSRLAHYVPGSHRGNPPTDREIEIIESCIAKQKRGTSETTRKAQLERSELQRQKTESRRNIENGRYSPHYCCDDIVRPFAKA